MSLAELKDKVAGLSSTERLELSAFLADLEQQNEVEFRKQVDQRMQDMDAGEKMSMEEFERQHRRLSIQGR
ncbi:MAG: hypothetical protein AAB466_00255 [Verrucomicrobiota bacterium]